MPGYQIPWVITNNRTGLSVPFLSASINYGRATYMDVYNGGGLTFTINNNANEAALIQMGDSIRFYSTAGGYDQGFWVDEIQCQDYPGDTGMAIATIVCSDSMVRLGRRLVTNLALPLAYSGEQAVVFNDVTQAPGITKLGDGKSLVSATTYTGAPMQRLNQLINTERGVIRCRGYELLYIPREQINQPAPIGAVSFGPTTSSSQIGYEQFARTGLGMNFMNTVAVTPTGGAEQIATNTASVTAYGSSYYSLQSEDSTNAQALGLAQWLSNSQADPTAERFDVEFTDRSQSLAPIRNVLATIMTSYVYSMSYRLPSAASLTNTKVIMEGYTLNITPSETRFQISLSPFTYYQFFRLDSDLLGVLDTSRLSW
jgi:hypothetical protein